MTDDIAKLEKPFTNKIVKHALVNVDDILANPENWKIHPGEQQRAIAGSIDEIGFIRSLTINLRTSELWQPGDRNVETLLDGEGRMKILLRSGIKEVPIEFVDLDPDEERKALLVLDHTAGMSAADKEKLDHLLREAQSDDPRIQALMKELAAKNDLYGLSDSDELDLSEFSQADSVDIRYRVVIDGLDLDQAHELAETIDGAKVEQYRDAK